MPITIKSIQEQSTFPIEKKPSLDPAQKQIYTDVFSLQNAFRILFKVLDNTFKQIQDYINGLGPGTPSDVCKCVARGYITVTNPNTVSVSWVLSNSLNISAVTRTARGRFRSTFTTPVPAKCIVISSSQFLLDANDNGTAVPGIDRHPGYGISTTAVDINIAALGESYIGLYDPEWLYIEVRDPAQFGT